MSGKHPGLLMRFASHGIGSTEVEIATARAETVRRTMVVGGAWLTASFDGVLFRRVHVLSHERDVA